MNLTPKQQKALAAWYKWFFDTLSFQTFKASEAANDLFCVFNDARPQLLNPQDNDPPLGLTDERELVIDLWCSDYSARLDRIISAGDKATEDYTGYEQDLFESFGCSTEPFEI